MTEGPMQSARPKQSEMILFRQPIDRETYTGVSDRLFHLWDADLGSITALVGDQRGVKKHHLIMIYDAAHGIGKSRILIPRLKQRIPATHGMKVHSLGDLDAEEIRAGFAVQDSKYIGIVDEGILATSHQDDRAATETADALLACTEGIVYVLPVLDSKSERLKLYEQARKKWEKTGLSILGYSPQMKGAPAEMALQLIHCFEYPGDLQVRFERMIQELGTISFELLNWMVNSDSVRYAQESYRGNVRKMLDREQVPTVCTILGFDESETQVLLEDKFMKPF